MMKIVAGISNLAEAEYFSGPADELYFGVPQIEDHRKWYDWQHVKSARETEKIIGTAHANGKKIYLAANEIYRPADQAAVLKDIGRVLALGADGLIVRDLFLLDYFSREAAGPELILSSTAVCFNKGAADFFGQFRISRTIIPQHVLPAEYAAVIRANPKMAYEIFYFSDCYCYNIDGICPYHDINRVKNPRNCDAPHTMNGEAFHMEKPPKALRQGMVYDYNKLKVGHIKMTRDGTFAARKAVLREIQYILKLLDNNVSREEFMEKTAGLKCYGKIADNK